MMVIVHGDLLTADYCQKHRQIKSNAILSVAKILTTKNASKIQRRQCLVRFVVKPFKTRLKEANRLNLAPIAVARSRTESGNMI